MTQMLVLYKARAVSSAVAEQGPQLDRSCPSKCVFPATNEIFCYFCVLSALHEVLVGLLQSTGEREHSLTCPG